MPLLMCGRVVSLASPTGAEALADGDYQLIDKMLGWPATALFPALDLARLLALDAVASQRLASAAGKLIVPGTAAGERSSICCDCSISVHMQVCVTSAAAWCHDCRTREHTAMCCQQVAALLVQLSAGQQQSHSLQQTSRRACA